MDKKKLNSFFSYCDEVDKSRVMAIINEDYSIWTEHKQALFINGPIVGLYYEKNEELLSLIADSCDYKDLFRLFKLEADEYKGLQSTQLITKYIDFQVQNEAKQDLFKWIGNSNYMLAFPIVNSREELFASKDYDYILSYVYVVLKYKFRDRLSKKESQYSFIQPNTEAIYKDIFDKSSIFWSWGLIPIDEYRNMYSIDNPARIYDSSLDKTIFLNMPRPVAEILEELYKKKYIKNLAVRSNDLEIYNGENHISVVLEEVEKGRVFSWDFNELPAVTKLYSANYEDCLWIKVSRTDITFEELCYDFYNDGNNVVTQMIHLQYNDSNITHLDHEYIYYDLESYELRKLNPEIRGEARKRVKTFKIDNSYIPMDYLCIMHVNETEIKIPFIFFILNNYFDHKDLLEEYFQKIM